MPASAPTPTLRPLSARSVVLSLMLGAEQPQLPSRHLVRLSGLFGITAPTLRVALSRMLAAGDLERAGDDLRLSPRHIARQRRQDDAVHPQVAPWDGTWELVVITATGRPADDRARLRDELARLRLAELREGVWTRPRNLLRPLAVPAAAVEFAARPADDPARLARELWPLEEWGRQARVLAERVADGARPPAERLAAAAASVRLLEADPALPASLRPSPWPGDALRAVYADYRRELACLTAEVARP